MKLNSVAVLEQITVGKAKVRVFGIKWRMSGLEY